MGWLVDDWPRDSAELTTRLKGWWSENTWLLVEGLDMSYGNGGEQMWDRQRADAAVTLGAQQAINQNAPTPLSPALEAVADRARRGGK